MDVWSTVRELLLTSSASWSVRIIDVEDGKVLFEHQPESELRSASMAKVALLTTVAAGIASGVIGADEEITRSQEQRVADSGIWQHLSVPTLPLDDVARLVGLASDNWATNMLLARVGGVPAVAAAAAAAGIAQLTLHDRVRDERTEAHPATLSTGSAFGYADVFARLFRGEVGSTEVSRRTLAWLADGFDLSMVAAAFGLDPLAHAGADRGVALVNKTGTDDGVRAEAGLLAIEGTHLAYAALANWTPVDTADPERDRVLAAMREIGTAMRQHALAGEHAPRQP